jgi:hypothetical protein
MGAVRSRVAERVSQIYEQYRVQMIDDLQREVVEQPVEGMELEAWLALRAEEAVQADARVAVVKSKNWETWGAPQYGLDRFQVKVHEGEVHVQSRELDSQGLPFYHLTLHPDGRVSEAFSAQLPFTPLLVLSNGSVLQQGWQEEPSLPTYQVVTILTLMAALLILVGSYIKVEDQKIDKNRFYDFVGQELGQELSAPKRII